MLECAFRWLDNRFDDRVCFMVLMRGVSFIPPLMNQDREARPFRVTLERNAIKARGTMLADGYDIRLAGRTESVR